VVQKSLEDALEGGIEQVVASQNAPWPDDRTPNAHVSGDAFTAVVPVYEHDVQRSRLEQLHRRLRRRPPEPRAVTEAPKALLRLISDVSASKKGSTPSYLMSGNRLSKYSDVIALFTPTSTMCKGGGAPSSPRARDLSLEASGASAEIS